VAEILRKVMIRLVESERSKTLLLQELAHRTKNNLAILSALVRLQARDKDPGIAEALENTSRRITVLAEVYDHLMLRDDTKVVDAREYLAQVFEKIRSVLDPAMPIAVTTESDEYYMPSTQAVPLAIIANELVTNAYKYAFSDGRPGHIHVALKVQDAIELSVSDNGIGLKNTDAPGGFGSRIIALLTQQLGGSYATNVWTRAAAWFCAFPMQLRRVIQWPRRPRWRPRDLRTPIAIEGGPCDAAGASSCSDSRRDISCQTRNIRSCAALSTWNISHPADWACE
jgi:two-component sensor histidine kinase